MCNFTLFLCVCHWTLQIISHLASLFVLHYCCICKIIIRTTVKLLFQTFYLLFSYFLHPICVLIEESYIYHLEKKKKKKKTNFCILIKCLAILSSQIKLFWGIENTNLFPIIIICCCYHHYDRKLR